jgi:hypothetical protein
MRPNGRLYWRLIVRLLCVRLYRMMRHQAKFIGIFILLLLSCKPAAGSGIESPGYVVRGNVVTAEVGPEEGGGVVCHLTVDLEFVNTASEPVILLQPFWKNAFWAGGKRLAKAHEDATLGRNLLHDSQQWLSVMNTPEYRELANRLDKPLPPAGLTRTLRPGEAWKYRTAVNIYFPKKRDYCSAPCVTGDELLSLSPLWLTLQFEMWPSNVENFKPDLGGKLSRRWRKVGRLWVGEKSGGFWFATATTKPILLDLKEAGKVKSY